MIKKLLFAALIVLPTAMTGCSICASPYEEAYGAYGGRWEREDQFNGRVGSAFSSASGEVIESETTILSPSDKEDPAPMPAQEASILQEFPLK